VFDYVFSEHMIEHVPYKEGLFMLSEACRVLKPGGRIRIGTPDVGRIVGLLTDTKSESQIEYVRWFAVQVLGLYSDQPSPLQQRRPEWAIDPGHIGKFFPDAGRDCACFVVNYFFRGFGHQFLYDERTLTAAMHEASFTAVKRAQLGHSEDIELDGIECHGQVIGDAANAFETMVLEAVRP
jgi:SAM-dependent methyltransferase